MTETLCCSKDEAYRNLSAAIICQAIIDWQAYKRKKEKAEIEQFFRSSWCESLLGFSGETILSRVEKIKVPYEVFGL